MYLIARGAEGLASWDDAEREKVPPENFLAGGTKL